MAGLNIYTGMYTKVAVRVKTFPKNGMHLKMCNRGNKHTCHICLRKHLHNVSMVPRDVLYLSYMRSMGNTIRTRLLRKDVGRAYTFP